MKKIFTHWTIGLLTLAILTFIGLGDPQVKEILRLKSFDFLLQSETKELSEDIGVVTIDEESIEQTRDNIRGGENLRRRHNHSEEKDIFE